MTDDAAPKGENHKQNQVSVRPGARPSDPGAADRLAAALRDNLRRRKQQARARKANETEPGPDGA